MSGIGPMGLIYFCWSIRPMNPTGDLQLYRRSSWVTNWFTCKVVSNIFYFKLYLGKWFNLTNIFPLSFVVIAALLSIFPDGSRWLDFARQVWRLPLRDRLGSISRPQKIGCIEWFLEGWIFSGLLATPDFCLGVLDEYPRHPNIRPEESVLGIFWGSKYILSGCLDV